jgi:hypothetical protein
MEAVGVLKLEEPESPLVKGTYVWACAGQAGCRLDTMIETLRMAGYEVRRNLWLMRSASPGTCWPLARFRWIAGSVPSDHGPRGAPGLKSPPWNRCRFPVMTSAIGANVKSKFQQTGAERFLRTRLISPTSPAPSSGNDPGCGVVASRLIVGPPWPSTRKNDSVTSLCAAWVYGRADSSDGAKAAFRVEHGGW